MIASLFAALALQVAPEKPPLVLLGEEAAYAEQVRALALTAVAEFTGEPCPGATVTPIRSVPMNAEENPADLPSAFERMRVEGCGRSTIQNVGIIRRAPTETWSMWMEYPGETRLAPRQADGMRSQIFTAIYEDLSPSCGRPALDDTYLIAETGDVGFSPARQEKAISLDVAHINSDPNLLHDAAWAEMWRMRVCGQERPIGLVLIPTRDGGLAMFPVPFWKLVTDYSDLPGRVEAAR